MQAAADAASARLKAWLIQQKAVEEEKRKLKLSIIMEKNRICDLPRQRLELLRHLAIFVSTIDCTDLAVTTFEDVIASEKYLQLGSFSSRAVECSTGSISDFVTVLTSPGIVCASGRDFYYTLSTRVLFSMIQYSVLNITFHGFMFKGLSRCKLITVIIIVILLMMVNYIITANSEFRVIYMIFSSLSLSTHRKKHSETEIPPVGKGVSS